jgi:DNA-directed RNA polymerase subunit RPC12/RpoP
MGTDIREVTFSRCSSEQELFKRWRAAQQDSSYEVGHDSYSGSLANAHLSVSRHETFATLDAAFKFANLESNGPDKREAIAYRYGDPSKVFPCTAKDRAVEEACTKLKQELDLFERSILLRFLASKSSSKKCSHCDSVISKKSRERLKHANYAQQLQQLQGFERKDLIAEQTQCPACGHNLLMTDTDIKRRESLAKRVAEVTAKRHAAYQAFTAKSADYGYVVIAAVPI